MANSQKKSPTSESSTHINPKVSVDEEDALTADFSDKEENPWIYCTEWTCKAFPLECDIQLRFGIIKQLCDIRHQFDVNQGVKLMNLCNTKQKVILVFGHDTKVNALNLITKFVDVRSTVLEFMQKVDKNVEDIKVSVRLRGQNQPEEQQGTGTKCLFESMQHHSQQHTSETTWFCKPDKSFAVADNATSNRYFTTLMDDINRKFRASLRTCKRGCVKFTVHHVNINDAVKMIIKHEEVRAMMLVCLQGIDSTVKDIQMDVQLQDFIDPPPLLEMRHLDKRYVNKQEHEEVVADLLMRLSCLEQKQLADTRMSLMLKRDDTWESSGFSSSHPSEMEALSPWTKQESDLHAIRRKEQTRTSWTPQGPETRVTSSDTETVIFDEEDFEDLSDPSEIAAPSPGTKRESDLHATSREEQTRKFRSPQGPETRATPTPAREHVYRVLSVFPARRDPLADNALFHEACMTGNLGDVKRFLAIDRLYINDRDKDGKTPVMKAAQYGKGVLVGFLVYEGADLSLTDDVGNTILHCACLGGDEKTVRYVLSLKGVDINATNNEGKTALNLARLSGHHHLVDLLVSPD